MLKKIDSFLSLFDFKVFLYFVIGEILIIPFVFFVGMYKIPKFYEILMMLSVIMCTSFFQKAMLRIYDNLKK